MNLRNITGQTLPAGTRVHWAGSPSPPSDKHIAAIYAVSNGVALAGWVIPEGVVDTELEACDGTELE